MKEAATIYRKVRSAIGKKAGVAVSAVKCEAVLTDPPLYLIQQQLESLAPVFQRIVRTVRPEAVILMKETGALKTVLDAYNLAGVRAGLAKADCSEIQRQLTQEG